MPQNHVLPEDIDYYLSQKRKYLDFLAGFFLAAVFWYLVFNSYWYAGPVLIALVAGFAIKMRVSRRYIAYGALGLLFLPWAICWSAQLFSMGSKE